MQYVFCCCVLGSLKFHAGNIWNKYKIAGTVADWLSNTLDISHTNKYDVADIDPPYKGTPFTFMHWICC